MNGKKRSKKKKVSFGIYSTLYDGRYVLVVKQQKRAIKCIKHPPLWDLGVDRHSLTLYTLLYREIFPGLKLVTGHK